MKRYAAKPTLSGAKAALLEVALEDTVAQEYAACKRRAYRDPAMRRAAYDSRIVRGSLIYRRVESMAGETRTARELTARRRVLEREVEAEKKSRDLMLRARMGCDSTWKKPPEPPGPSTNLEEIVDREPDKEPEVETPEMLRDQFLERPETPPYVPAVTEEEVETQIEPGDLWDFDLEVWPYLEALVGGTTRQALIEVIEEEERDEAFSQKAKYAEMQLAELVEKLRLEEQERRLREEVERRIRQFHLAMALQKEAEERVMAAMLTAGYIADLLPNVLEGLDLTGYRREDIREFVVTDFIPPLGGRVLDHLEARVTAHDVLTAIVREIQETCAAVYARLGDEEVLPLPLLPSDTHEAPPSRTEIAVVSMLESHETLVVEPEPVRGKRPLPPVPIEPEEEMPVETELPPVEEPEPEPEPEPELEPEPEPEPELVRAIDSVSDIHYDPHSLGVELD